VVDARRILRLLQRVKLDVDRLNERARDRAVLRADFDRLAALKYLFVTAIEGCIDSAQHLCASEGWGRPTSNADAVLELGRRGVLDPDLAASVARAVGFRNVLVHGYIEVDDDRVIAALDRVGDLAAYVSRLAAWVAKQERL
jgi:uncharacterized protein YutE (UPF0331/DUF86 family)